MFNSELYNSPYHNLDLSKYKFLVTGGAGFIGSNIVEYLLKYNAGHVRVLDNLSNGYIENIRDFSTLPNFEFINGDIRDLEICYKAIDGIDFISHQAALGSVPRSISDPLLTNSVNINGFLNMLVAAKDSVYLKQFVYAASSSTYGDSKILPKVEGNEGNPLSPYAVTKLVNELYATVFSRVYNFNTIGLRYFNVFGPKQNPNNPYAAVIPIFCKHYIDDTEPTIYGDGNTSRDFTFVENVVQANIKCLLCETELQENINFNVSGSTKKTEKKRNSKFFNNEVYNVACGDQISINKLIEVLETITGKKIKTNYGPERKGDVRHSNASIKKIEQYCSYKPLFNFEQGLKIVFDWYLKNI